MIDLKSLTEDDLGRTVLYTPSAVSFPHHMIFQERGVVTSWNETYIFVRYGANQHSNATSPRDLEWDHDGD